MANPSTVRRVSPMRRISTKKSHEWRGHKPSSIEPSGMYDLTFYTGVMIGMLQSAKFDLSVIKTLTKNNFSVKDLDNLISVLNTFSQCFSNIDYPLQKTGTRG